MGEKYKSLDAKTRYTLLTDIGNSITSTKDGRVKYLEGLSDQTIAGRYGVHVTTVARSRRDVFGELVRGPNGPHKKKKAAATDRAVLDLIDKLNLKIEDMSYKLDALITRSMRSIGQPSYEAAKKPAPIRKYKPAPGTGYYREDESASEPGHAVYTRETEEDKPTSYVK